MGDLTLIAKARRQGLGWAYRRTLRELYAPTTRIGRMLRPVTAPAWTAFRGLRRVAQRRGDPATGTMDDVLTFFYDLDVSPVTYDFACYLALAEMRRRDLGLKELHVVFVPGRQDGLRHETPDYDAAVDADARRWRLHNICVALIALVPACRSYTICSSREQAAAIEARCGKHVHPEGYETAFPLCASVANIGRTQVRLDQPNVFQVPAQGRAYLRPWIDAHVGGRKLVTITLRQYGFQPMRNSNLAAWSAFARGLDPREYCVVVIPDTDAALRPVPEEFEGLTHFREACWNLGLRAAIYEAAWLNLANDGGPIGICWFNTDTRYINFNILRPNSPQPIADKRLYLDRGYQIGETPPFATAGQKWVWEADDLDVIQREFSAMAAWLADAPPPSGGTGAGKGAP